jgi:hypothetical protein
MTSLALRMKWHAAKACVTSFVCASFESDSRQYVAPAIEASNGQKSLNPSLRPPPTS